MAITVAIVKRSGGQAVGRQVIADVTFDSSYPAGGEPYTAAMFGLNRIDYLETQLAKASSTTAMACLADHTASTLMLFNSNGAAPAALLETSTVNQSATVVRVRASELPHV
jgi:hypothetical protein